MLDNSLASQLKTLLEKVIQPIELVSTLDDRPKSAELAGLLDEIAAMSELVTHSRTGDDPRRPSFVIRRAGTDIEVGFAG
ncbi:alkyl hydroperoxide reductase subunit F, partial [Nocardia tengchongensis]